MIEDPLRSGLPAGRTRAPTAIASVVAEAFASDGHVTSVDTQAAAIIVGEALTSYLAPPAAHFPGVDGELVCIFPDLGRDDAAGVLNTARRALRNRQDIPDVMVSFSAGLATTEATEDRQRTLDTARQLRTNAQSRGGDRVQIQTDAPDERPLILLAEDDALTARLIIHRLQAEGYDVAHHPDGQSALEAARSAGSEPYALAILDVKMPRMDGFELLDRLKEDPKLGSTPVVMLTGMGAEQDVARALTSGADDYILKPFSPTELALRVQRLLAK